jgi:hypothetical protein
MSTEKMPKNAEKYYCEKCDFGCNKLSNYNNHLKTKKHKSTENQQNQQEKCQKMPNNYVCECGKIYKERTGLWKHKKTCDYTEFEETSKITKTSGDDVSVKDVMVMMMEDRKQMMDLMKHINTTNNTTNTNTNSHNTNNFNMSFFLNEQCKDALNIMDFVNSVKVKMNEVEDVGALGYAEGIGRIFVRALNELDVYQRPIHCSDLKRETLYVKDENGWEKEEETTPKVKKSIRHLAHQNVKAISEWKEKNSSWQKRHSQTEAQYYKITGNSMGACEPEGNEKNYNKIIRKVAKEVTIDKNNV